jgi:hypothetical protein
VRASIPSALICVNQWQTGFGLSVLLLPVAYGLLPTLALQRQNTIQTVWKTQSVANISLLNNNIHGKTEFSHFFGATTQEETDAGFNHLRPDEDVSATLRNEIRQSATIIPWVFNHMCGTAVCPTCAFSSLQNGFFVDPMTRFTRLKGEDVSATLRNEIRQSATIIPRFFNYMCGTAVCPNMRIFARCRTGFLLTR